MKRKEYFDKMKIRIKKIIAVALALVMLLCLTSCATGGSASVNDANGSYGNFTWSYTKDTKTLTINGSGDMLDAASSAEVGWTEVRLGVEAGVLSSSITSIGDYAFFYMPKLKSITLHEGITDIGKQAFAFCTSLGSVVIPEGVTSVGDSAFEGCSSLTVAKLPATLTDMGDRVFFSCGKLETVQILGNIKAIGNEAFANCISLEKLLLNPALSGLVPAENAFENCKIDIKNATFTTSEDGSCVITIKYLDESGNQLSDPKALTLALGSSYSEVSPVIEGYTADILTVTGTANGTDEVITVTYKSNQVETESVESETEPEEDDGFTATDLVAIIIFTVVVVGIGVFAFVLIRSDKKNANKSGTVRKNDNGKKNKK